MLNQHTGLESIGVGTPHIGFEWDIQEENCAIL